MGGGKTPGGDDSWVVHGGVVQRLDHKFVG